MATTVMSTITSARKRVENVAGWLRVVSFHLAATVSKARCSKAD